MTPLPAADIRGLLDRYERPLIRYAQSIVGDLESARDVVQDTFIRYVRHTSGQQGEDDAMQTATATLANAPASEAVAHGEGAALLPSGLSGQPDSSGPAAPASQPTPGLDPGDTKHVEGWLFTVARNRALDYVRKNSRIIPMPLPEDRPSEERGPDEMLESQDAAEWLLKLLDALTPNQREVIRLKFQSDLSYKEISDVTGLSVTNVGFILHVGLKKLRTLLREAPVDSLPIRLRTAP